MIWTDSSTPDTYFSEQSPYFPLIQNLKWIRPRVMWKTLITDTLMIGVIGVPLLDLNFLIKAKTDELMFER